MPGYHTYEHPARNPRRADDVLAFLRHHKRAMTRDDINRLTRIPKTTIIQAMQALAARGLVKIKKRKRKLGRRAGRPQTWFSAVKIENGAKESSNKKEG